MSAQLVVAPDLASNVSDLTFVTLLAHLACPWHHPSRRTSEYSGGRFCFSCYRPSRLIVLVDHNLQLPLDCLVVMQVVVAIVAWLLERGLGKSDQTAGCGRTSSQTS